jgi:hypothetical protein
MPPAFSPATHGLIAALAAAGLGLALAACSGIEPIPPDNWNDDSAGPGLLTGPSGVFTIPVPGPWDDPKAAKP